MRSPLLVAELDTRVLSFLPRLPLCDLENAFFLRAGMLQLLALLFVAAPSLAQVATGEALPLCPAAPLKFSNLSRSSVQVSQRVLRLQRPLLPSSLQEATSATQTHASCLLVFVPALSHLVDCLRLTLLSLSLGLAMML